MKKIIAILGAFAFAFFSVSTPCLFGKEYIVSALSSSGSSVYITQGFTNINSFTSGDQQFLNTHVFPDNSFQVISTRTLVNQGILSFDLSSMHDWGSVSYGGQSFQLFVNRPSRSSSVDYLPSYINYQGVSLSLDSQTFFVALPVGTYDYAYLHNFTSDFLNGSNGFLDSYSDADIVFWGASSGNPETRVKSFNTHFIDNSFTPEYETVNLPFYSLDVDGFYDWIINNNKLVELPAYITQAKLKSFIEFYKSFGSSNTSFITKIVDWFSHMNIASQSSSNISALKQSIDKLYQEYINYRSGTHAYWPVATKIQERDTIDTKTDNNDLTLVIDDNSDPLDISILRDILRGVIAISNNVNQGCANIVQKLDELNFVVNVVNDGGDNSPIDLSSLYIYDSNAFSNDLHNFEASIEDVQSVPQGYINTINQNSLMPENMLEDKNSLTVNIPTITGFTVGNNGSAYSTQTGSYQLRSAEYPWLDTAVQKIKRFASILLIMGYLVHLRYRIPEIVRGE